MSEVIEIGSLKVAVQRSERRTLGVSVLRDGSISATAPVGASLDKITALLKRRELWLHRALLHRKSASKGVVAKDYVSGEGFHYLGRKYRLKVIDAISSERENAALRLFEGRFLMNAAAVSTGREHFIRWYRQRAESWLKEHLPDLAKRVGVQPTKITVMDLGFRWGSCSSNGRINFHWRVMLLPAEIVSYLVLHELCHLIEHSHSKAFWALVARADHEFDRKEQWLRDNGARFNI